MKGSSSKPESGQGRRELSSYVNEAVRRQLQHDRLADLILDAGAGVVLTGDADDLAALAASHPHVVIQTLWRCTPFGVRSLEFESFSFLTGLSPFEKP